MAKKNEYADRAKIFAPFAALKGFEAALREKEKIKHINIINVQHVNKLFVYQKDAERLKSAVQSVILSLSKELRGTKYVEGITYSSFR